MKPTPGRMTKLVADLLGKPHTLIESYDRKLLEAGLRTKGGRGLSAPAMTAFDVARLLIVATIQPQLSEVEGVCCFYSNLACSSIKQFELLVGSVVDADLLDESSGIRVGMNFDAALADAIANHRCWAEEADIERITAMFRAGRLSFIKNALDALDEDESTFPSAQIEVFKVKRDTETGKLSSPRLRQAAFKAKPQFKDGVDYSSDKPAFQPTSGFGFSVLGFDERTLMACSDFLEGKETDVA